MRESEFYRCGDRGVLAQFRHQHFLLFLIAHFQKATLLMVSDQLAEALNALDITKPDSIKRFKRQIRLTYVSFLGFTHRYWFHEVSEQAQVKALFNLCTRHLQIDALYAEVKERIRDMNSYLDADALRRQANTVVRLTVVTVFGLIGTITTGFLGMNLIAAADAPLTTRTLFFLVVLGLTIALTVYTMVKSKRLSDFLDVGVGRAPLGLDQAEVVPRRLALRDVATAAAAPAAQPAPIFPCSTAIRCSFASASCALSASCTLRKNAAHSGDLACSASWMYWSYAIRACALFWISVIQS